MASNIAFEQRAPIPEGQSATRNATKRPTVGTGTREGVFGATVPVEAVEALVADENAPDTSLRHSDANTQRLASPKAVKSERKSPEPGLDIQTFSDLVEITVQKSKAEQTACEAPSANGRELQAVFGSRDALDGGLASNDRLHPKKRTGRLRVAAYIRVSTDQGNQADSYALQDRYFRDLLSSHPGWVSAGIYADYGKSATSREKRNGFNRLIRHCEEGRIDRIICKSISRFARNTADFLTAIRVLNQNGVSILFEKEGLDTVDPTSELIMTALGAIAQEESRCISENLLWGYAKRYPKGEVKNLAIYGYRFMKGGDAWETTAGGYRIHALEECREEADVVRRIFREYVEAERNFAEIARGLNRDGIPAPKGNQHVQRLREQQDRHVREAGSDSQRAQEPRRWTAAQIGRIIAQERYVGDVLIQKWYSASYLEQRQRPNRGEKPQYWVQNHHLAILDRETYDAAQRLRESRKKKNSHVRTPLPFTSRLICGKCGRFFSSRNPSNPIWFCQNTTTNAGDGSCTAKRVYEKQLICMFRMAVLNRFELNQGADDTRMRALLSGVFVWDEQNDPLSEGSRGFVNRMILQMERFERDDDVERDRAFMKRSIFAMQMEANAIQRRQSLLASQIRGDEIGQSGMAQTASAEELEAARQALTQTERALQEKVAAIAQMEARIRQMEEYWIEVEKNHVYRKKALEWMKGLPCDKRGTVAFLNGMETEYVRAFVLRVIILDPCHYKVWWYDNTTTEVELFSNVDEGVGLTKRRR